MIGTKYRDTGSNQGEPRYYRQQSTSYTSADQGDPGPFPQLFSFKHRAGLKAHSSTTQLDVRQDRLVAIFSWSCAAFART